MKTAFWPLKAWRFGQAWSCCLLLAVVAAQGEPVDLLQRYPTKLTAGDDSGARARPTVLEGGFVSEGPAAATFFFSGSHRISWPPRAPGRRLPSARVEGAQHPSKMFGRRSLRAPARSKLASLPPGG